MSSSRTPGGLVLVTGGTGFIGSHACVSLVQAGFSPVIFDNLSNSSRGVLPRLAEICGQSIPFVEGDIRDRAALRQLFQTYRPVAVIHFAGLKSVSESVEQPGRYHENNVTGSQYLLEAMQEAAVKQLVFSSSATVYGVPESVPIAESAPLKTSNPYGQSKLDVEQLLAEWCAADPQWSIACLRYFNPVGAHPSGLIGENPKGIPSNLMPYITQVAVGKREFVNVFGDDYPTPDGTGVRDYLHVMDLAEGHIAALEYLRGHSGIQALNLGTGRGVSVLEMISAFEATCSRPVPHRIVARRAGDSAAVWADPSLAQRTLGWRTRRSLEEMCADSWRWQQRNPEGYENP